MHSVPTKNPSKKELRDSFLYVIQRNKSDIPFDKQQVVEDFSLQNKDTFMGSGQKLGRFNLYEHGIYIGDALPIRQWA